MKRLLLAIVATITAGTMVFFYATNASAYANGVSYTGQGLIADGFGGYDLRTELCGIANGADADGPYLLWVMTATGAKNADITGPWGTVPMTKTGNGTFKYISGWYDPSTLPGAVVGTYDGKAKNTQLVISHGCRPFVRGGVVLARILDERDRRRVGADRILQVRPFQHHGVRHLLRTRRCALRFGSDARHCAHNQRWHVQGSGRRWNGSEDRGSQCAQCV